MNSVLLAGRRHGEFPAETVSRRIANDCWRSARAGVRRSAASLLSPVRVSPHRGHYSPRVASRSPVSIAIDAGTTGVRALVVDERARVVDVAYRELTQYYPRPGWVEHDADEIWEAVRTTLADVAGRLAETQGWPGPSASPTSARRWWPGTGAPAIRCTGPSSGRTAGRPPACRALVEAGHLPMVRERTGLVLDPYFSATKMQWLLDEGGLAPGTGSPSAPSTPGCCGTSPEGRTAGCWPPTPPTPRGPCSSTSWSGGGRRSCATSSGSPRARSPRSDPPAAGSGGCRTDPRCRIPAPGSGDQRDGRRPARRALRPGLLRPGHDQGHHRDGQFRPHERRLRGPGPGRRVDHHPGLGPRHRRGRRHRR